MIPICSSVDIFLADISFLLSLSTYQLIAVESDAISKKGSFLISSIDAIVVSCFIPLSTYTVTLFISLWKYLSEDSIGSKVVTIWLYISYVLL